MKYIVQKADTGEAVEECFVLRPKEDWAARYAVKAYADMTPNLALRKDLLKWVGTFPCSAYDPKSARIDQSALELKPCPRCGGKGLIYYEGYKSFYAECEDCPLELHDIYFSAEEAAEAWNYRADEENTPLTIEELREMGGEPVWIEYIPSPDEECTGLWALVSIDKEYDEIFLLNSIGGSSSYEEALADIRAIYRRKPNEGVPR